MRKYISVLLIAGALSLAYAGLDPCSNCGGGSIPDQTGNNGKFLTTDGTNTSWGTVSGTGTVTHTGNLTSNALVLGNAVADTKVVAGITSDGTSMLTLGVNTTTLGKLKLFGSTSGDATIQPPVVAGTATVVTLPNASSTLPIFGQQITFTGPTAARSIALPDAAFTVARTDAANTFTGTQTVGALVATTVNGNTITTGTGVLTLGAGKTTTFDHTSTFTTTDAQTYTFPTTSATLARTDAANTFTGVQTFTAPVLGTPTSETITDAQTYTHDLTAIPNSSGGWSEYFVTGSDFVCTNGSGNNCAAALDITGMVTGTLSASTVYEFDVVIRYLNAADTAGSKFYIHGGGTGSAATVFALVHANTSSVTASNIAALDTIDSGTAGYVAFSGGEGLVTLHGFFTSRSTGTPTMSVQVSKVTSLNATVRVGSVLRIRKAHT